MPVLHEKLSDDREEEFDLMSTDFFRPPLKQIGNSLYEIKTHFMSNNVINIIPPIPSSHVAQMQTTLLRHFGDDSFLYKNNIVTNSPVDPTVDSKKTVPSLVVLMESLALAMDFEISPRPRDVQCDVFLAICGQPVIVLTLVGGDKDSETVTIYNTSVARGVTTTLRRFMDESVYVVHGVLCIQDLEELDTFQTAMEAIAKDSSQFITVCTLETSSSKYEKIMTAFWAGVAETRSVISTDGQVDSNYLRFLTKDQCVILMENINKREVEVQFQTGTGATTLMVEVARRLSKLDDTLLVCGSQEEKERLKSVYPNTITMAEMKLTDLSKYTNIVGETEASCDRVHGKLWNFIKVYSGPEQCQLLQHKIKTFENVQVTKMPVLHEKLSDDMEEEFDLMSTDFFRPPLKQIGNSLYEIKTHFMSNNVINIIPPIPSSHVAQMQTTLLRHFGDDSFLYKNNIVTNSPVDPTVDSKKTVPSLVVLMESLALAMDFEISPRSSDVQCDVFLAICGQPVIVLTLVSGDKDSETVTIYNTSVARGVTTTLRRFMDESVYVVHGVLCIQDLEELDTFQTAMEAIAKDSSQFITVCTLETSSSKYEKIMTAFWAGVAETRSVISTDGQVDSNYLRFLTKDQCVILMENINKKEVEVQFQTGTGATTLMVEVARRLSKLDDTLLVCGSQEEKERLKSVYPNTITMAEMELTDLSKYTNIVGETEASCDRVHGKLWNFIKVYSGPEQCQLLQHKIKMFENETMNIEKIILLASSGDRKDKMNHLVQETEILKLFDIRFQQLLVAYHLPARAALEVLPVKRDSSVAQARDQSLQVGDYISYMLQRLKQDIMERRDLFPLLGEMLRQMKYSISHLQVEVEYLKQVTSTNRPKSGDWKKQSGYSDHDDLKLGTLVGETVNGDDSESGESPNAEQTETQSVQETEVRDQRLQFGGYIRHMLQRLKKDKKERRDFTRLKKDKKERRDFPLVGEMLRKIKYSISHLKVEYLKKVTSTKRPKSGTREKQFGFSDHDDVKLGTLVGETVNGDKSESGESPNAVQTETKSVQVKPGVTAQEGVSDRLNTEQIEELKKELVTLTMEAERKKQELNEIREDYGVEWEYNMECLSQNMAKLKIQDIITDVIGENVILVLSDKQQKTFTFLDDNCSTKRRGVSRCQVHQLRKLQFGRLGHSDLLAIVGHLFTNDQSRLTDLRTRIDHLEHEYGSLVHIVGELETKKSGPVSCPHMELDRDRVNGDLSVSESGELTNVEKSWGDQHVRSRGGKRVKSRGDQHVRKFKRYSGTCSRLPLPPSPSTLSVPRYWESKSRLRVKEDVSGWSLIDLGVTREEEMDSWWWLRGQSGTWSVRAWYCDVHKDICTWVYKERSQCGGCHRNHLSPTPGTGVRTIHCGVVVDMGRGRVGFVDVTRGRVLHRFDVNITDSLRPMFGVTPRPDHCEIHTRLLSGAEISMDGNKQSLIAKALFGANRRY